MVEFISTSEIRGRWQTLVGLLRAQAAAAPHRVLYTFLEDRDGGETALTREELDRRARMIAVGLRRQIVPGDRVLLLYPPGLDYIAGFFGCLYAGAVAVPAYPPRRNRPMRRLRAMADHCQATVVLTTTAVRQRLARRLDDEPELAARTWLTSDTFEPDEASGWHPPEVDAQTLAFLQYTSGSTGDPKGVMLTHGNLLHNLGMITRCFAQDAESIAVIWLPPYHDMGLIGGILQPLYGGSQAILMSPSAFFQRPVAWLESIARFRATTSGGPNFAYDLCLRRTTPEQRAALDLSTWTVAFNGAEPISARTLDDFAAGFADSGFRRAAFRPCYGLAEATLIVSGGQREPGPVTKTFDRDALARGTVAPEAPDAATLRLAGSGSLVDGQDLCVVDPVTLEPREPHQVGEIWVSSPSVARGYWGEEVASQEGLRARLADSDEGSFLRTGDLGFVHESELFVTGRLKDLIIVRGRNVYPQDIEQTVAACHPDFSSGASAAFGLEIEGREQLVVVQEIERRALRRFDAEGAFDIARAAVAEEHQLQLHTLACIRTASLPKTSSGKVRRRATREHFVRGALKLVGTSSVARRVATEVEPRFDLDRQQLVASADAEAALDAFLRHELDRLLAAHNFDEKKPLARLGMDSLQAVELQHVLETTLQVSIPYTAFLDDLTLVDLRARVLDAIEQAPLDLEPVAVTTAGADDVGEGPVTHGERALWFLQKLAPESAAYNLACAVRVTPDFEMDALRQAIAAIARRHPALRTTFPAQSGRPLRRIASDAQVELDVIDAREWSEARWSETLETERHRPFDLERGPLFRLLVCRTSSGPILLSVIHHIVADFWSLTVFVRELAHHLDPSTADRPLPPVAFSPLAHARSQARRLAERQDALLGYWRTALDGAPTALDLPFDKPRPEVQTFEGDVVSRDLDPLLMDRLEALCRQRGITLYTLLLAAYGVLLHRHSGQTDILIGTPTATRPQAALAQAISYLINVVVMRLRFEDDPAFTVVLDRLRRQVTEALDHADLPFSVLVEHWRHDQGVQGHALAQAVFIYQKAPVNGAPDLTGLALGAPGARVQVGGLGLESVPLANRTAQFDLTLIFGEGPERSRLAFNYNTHLFERPTIERLAARFEVLLEGIAADPRRAVSALPVLTTGETKTLLQTWNDTEEAFDGEHCVHQLFEARVAACPDDPALVFEDQVMTFADLDTAANRMAQLLVARGIGLDDRVGVCLFRGPQMVAALLGIFKAGAAYVPLDPSYPVERQSAILEDAGASVLVTSEALARRFPQFEGSVLALDQLASELAGQPATAPTPAVGPTHLAYVIYTSGSTGRPKGVMLPHRAVINFFAGMDRSVGCDANDSLLAVTSISFDISVLELFWTLTRGCQVVLLAEDALLGGGSAAANPIDFSLFYFSADAAGPETNKYEILLEGARYADAHGFSAVWTPERHFHAFGGLYPNPSVTGAALSTITRNLRIRSGSVVLPLHHPIRVAEEWSVVDNLSGGRAEISVASGWQPNDFVLRPEAFEERRRHTSEGIETLRTLWAGGTIEAMDGSGKSVAVAILPQPVQDQIPIWYTSGGNPETFAEAGRLGAHVLTHLLGQTFDEVAEKIAIYRQARGDAGFDPATGKVALMLHTFLGEDLESIRETTRAPFKNYLRTAFGLVTKLIETMDLPLDVKTMTDADRETLLDFAYERYFNTAALFGTVESVQPLLEQVHNMGVDEIACLIDFGIETQEVLASLPRLKEAMERAKRVGRAAAFSFEAQSRRYQPTLLQCTPSTLRGLFHHAGTAAVTTSLRKVLLGGEALPVDLARTVHDTLSVELINMYGPTETAIWSATWPVTSAEGTIPIGRPITNTRLFIVDRAGHPVPTGTPGELWIGGCGLARGYERRPALTAIQFVPDPFSGEPGERLYRTGDLARYRPDGAIEFLGRLDFQIKLRGYRIELGEIETVLEAHPEVAEAVVMARDVDDHQELAAYLVPLPSGPTPPESTLREFLATSLPAYMIPSRFLVLEHFPLTPNGKVDRKALPTPDRGRDESAFVAPDGRIEQQVAAIWREALGLDTVGANDNFFDLGGHSLLMSQVHGRINEAFGKEVPLVKMLELPTIASLARYLTDRGVEGDAAARGKDRAQMQRQARRRRRRVPA